MLSAFPHQDPSKLVTCTYLVRVTDGSAAAASAVYPFSSGARARENNVRAFVGYSVNVVLLGTVDLFTQSAANCVNVSVSVSVCVFALDQISHCPLTHSLTHF